MPKTATQSQPASLSAGTNLVEDAQRLRERVIARMDLGPQQVQAVTGQTQVHERQFQPRDSRMRPCGEAVDGLVALASAYDPRTGSLRLQGVYKGGWRPDLGVTEAEMRFLAAGMDDKADILGIHKEGGKSGAVVDPQAYGPTGMLDVARGFAHCFQDLLGIRYVAATDLGSTPAQMAAMAEVTGPDSVTGKPVDQGGLQGQGLCTGYGAAAITRLASAYHEQPLVPGTRILVHGAGKAGIVVARFLSQWGCIVGGIADKYAGVLNEAGVDLEALQAHIRKTGSVSGFMGGDEVAPDEVLFQQANNLIIASTENIITASNADRVQASLVTGVANGPVTLDAQTTLAENGICYISDKLASIFGVYGSDLELDHFQGTEHDVLEMVARKAETVFPSILRVMEKFQMESWAEGAQALAFANRLESLGLSYN